jgi:hypothetical protein
LGGGIKRNRSHLPGGRGSDGGEPQPGDERIGDWMDGQFVSAVQRALRTGGESQVAAGATVEPRRR